MIIYFTGAPGSGKSTLINRLAEFDGAQAVRTGRLLRQASESDSEHGKQITREMEGGGLLPSKLVVDVLRRHMKDQDDAQTLLISGFPRREDQIPAVFELAESTGRQVGALLVLDIPRDVAIERISGRRICPKCGAIYHIKFNPPKNDEICDHDDTPLNRRADDAPEAVEDRFQNYRDQTEPVFAKFREKHPKLFHEIDAAGSPDEVFDRALEVLNQVVPDIFPESGE